MCLTIFVCEMTTARGGSAATVGQDTHICVRVGVRGKERERELFPCPISQPALNLLMDVGLLNFYQEGNSSLLE
jgi:hypothetical protein